MVTRIWHGWTTPEDAGAYQELLQNEVFPRFGRQHSGGYRGVALMRRDHAAEVEFLVMTWFDSLEAVRAFAGDDCEVAVVPSRARPLLVRFDERAAHYDTVVPPPREAAS